METDTQEDQPQAARLNIAARRAGRRGAQQQESPWPFANVPKPQVVRENDARYLAVQGALQAIAEYLDREIKWGYKCDLSNVLERTIRDPDAAGDWVKNIRNYVEADKVAQERNRARMEKRAAPLATPSDPTGPLPNPFAEYLGRQSELTQKIEAKLEELLSSSKAAFDSVKIEGGVDLNAPEPRDGKYPTSDIFQLITDWTPGVTTSLLLEGTQEERTVTGGIASSTETARGMVIQQLGTYPEIAQWCNENDNDINTSLAERIRKGDPNSVSHRPDDYRKKVRAMRLLHKLEMARYPRGAVAEGLSMLGAELGFWTTGGHYSDYCPMRGVGATTSTREGTDQSEDQRVDTACKRVYQEFLTNAYEHQDGVLGNPVATRVVDGLLTILFGSAAQSSDGNLSSVLRSPERTTSQDPADSLSISDVESDGESGPTSGHRGESDASSTEASDSDSGSSSSQGYDADSDSSSTRASDSDSGSSQGSDSGSDTSSISALPGHGRKRGPPIRTHGQRCASPGGSSGGESPGSRPKKRRRKRLTGP